MPPADDPLLSFIQRDEKERRAELERRLPACSDAPSLAALYLYVAEGVELTVDVARHVRDCSSCARILRQVRQHLASLASDQLDDRILRSDRTVVADRMRTTVGITGRIRSALMPAARHWRAGIGGLAAAAVVVFAVVAFFERTQSARADDALFRRIALRLVLLPDFDPFLSDNPVVLQALIDEVDSFRQQRDEAVQLAAEAPDAESRSKAAGNALHPWAHVYRSLRDLGRFEEAFAEIHRCMQFCRTDPSLGEETGWYLVLLADLGNLHLSMADLPNARRAYQDSINAREKRLQARFARGDLPVNSPDRASSGAHDLAPLYWSMSRVAIAEGNFHDAHEWFQRSDLAFRTYFAAVCEANGITCPANGDALAAFRATPDVFQAPPDRTSKEEHARFAAQYKGFVPSTGLNTKLHAHLYFTACLALAEGNVATAKQTLDAAKSVPLFYCTDEDRLDFYEPLLAARIAIAEKRYHDATALIAEAEQHTGRPPCADTANNRPIASARIAELTLLKGVAMLGVDEKNADGAQLVEQALKVPMKLAEGLPPGQREIFLHQFDVWEKLADEVRRTAK